MLPRDRQVCGHGCSGLAIWLQGPIVPATKTNNAGKRRTSRLDAEMPALSARRVARPMAKEHIEPTLHGPRSDDTVPDADVTRPAVGKVAAVGMLTAAVTQAGSGVASVNRDTAAAERLRAELIARIRARTAHVGVVGLGYVGLPFAVEKAKVGFPVTGIEQNPLRAAAVNRGERATSPTSSTRSWLSSAGMGVCGV